MESPLGKIAFVVEELGLDTPAQQLLDRFLIGYPRDGDFHRCQSQVGIWLAPGSADSELRRRLSDFPIGRHDTVESAVREADGIIVCPRGVSSEALVSSAIRSAAANTAVFVLGAIAESIDDGKRIASLAAAGSVMLTAGTPISVTFRLPDVDIPVGAKVNDALIIVQGESPRAELHALDGLLPILERRQKGERGVRRLRRLEGAEIWSAPDGLVPRRLLAAALSRSDSPQGDPVKDGRTQDILGLGLVPKLARNPRGWVLEHADGVRTAILVLDGVVADINFAIGLGDGTIVSAQLYRPPAPQRHEFSRLASVVEDFLRTRKHPAPALRAMLVAGLLGAFAKAGGSGDFVPTPELELAAISKI